MENPTRREVVTAVAGAAGVVAIAGTAAAQEPKPDPRKRIEGAEFVVKFNGVKLTPEIERALAAEIQGATLRELAKFDMGGPFNATIPYREWLGIWLEKIKAGQVPGISVNASPTGPTPGGPG